MNKALSLLIIALMSTYVSAQSFKAIVDQGSCMGYDLTVNDIAFNGLDSCEFGIEQELGNLGSNATLSLSNSPDFAPINGITTLDMVFMARILLDGDLEDLDLDDYDLNWMIYSADYDQDGAVSTYDIVALLALILGVEAEYDLQQYHPIPADLDFPELDPFDITVDYSELNFVYDSSIDSINLEVLQIGNLSIHSN